METILTLNQDTSSYPSSATTWLQNLGQNVNLSGLPFFVCIIKILMVKLKFCYGTVGIS